MGNKKYINYSTPQEVGANSFTSTLGVLCEKNNLFSNKFSNTKKQLLTLLLIILMSFSFFTISVYGNTPEEKNYVFVIIRANVDSRVIESQASIMVEFENKDNGDSYFVTLQPYNEYCAKTYMPQGEYMMISGGVANDYNVEYPVHGVSFSATGATAEVTFDVGDPAYIVSAPPVSDVLQGDFDYNKTNSLLNEDNMETINWSQLNENMDPYNTDPDNPYLGNNNTPVSSDEFIEIIPSDTTETVIGENETTEYPVYENYESVTEAENEGDTQPKKSPAIIILVVVVAVIVAVVIYLKSKKTKSSEV